MRIESELHFYRPCSKVDVNSLTDKSLLEELVSEGDLLVTKAGCLGLGRLAVSFPSMKTTFDIIGRSLGSSCTHNRPTFAHLRNSFPLHVSLSVASIRSNGLLSFHNFHACEAIIRRV